MRDLVKTSGQLKSANPMTGGAGMGSPIIATVKDNIDPTRSGRIRVLLSNKLPNDPDSSKNWITVSKLSAFSGSTSGSSGSSGSGSFKTNPSSYGMASSPPDIGSQVLCIFANNDINQGFYIGGVPSASEMHSVPVAGAATDNVVPNEGEASSLGGAPRLPVTNFNNNNSESSQGDFNDQPRPVHSSSAAIHAQQGTVRDAVRGPSGSSSARDPVNRVGFGVNTPGRPIYKGGYDDTSIAQNLDPSKGDQLSVESRRNGHSISMDDGDLVGRDQGMTIRSALGHQIKMSDDGQTLMILHSNGQSYVELGKEGTIDIFGTNSFNVRTQGDINLHADRNVTIHAAENLNLQAKNININSEEATKARAGTDMSISASAKITGLAGGPMAWQAKGEASLVGGGQTFINGSKVNLNSGSPSETPEPISPIPLVAHTDTLHDADKGFAGAPGKQLSTTSRMPTHAPFAGAGQGVDVKNSPNASDNLPQPASPSTGAANQAAAATNPIPPAVATMASAPAGIPSISDAMNMNVTAASIAQVATAAASGPLASAVKAGAGIIKTAQGAIGAVGSLGLTPSQLDLGGALKPGAGILVNTMIQAGKSMTRSMPNSVFSGKIPGATSLDAMIKSTSAQSTTLVNTMKKAQSALTVVGAISGREAPTQISGLVHAASTVGLGPTLAAVHSVTSLAKTASNVLGAASVLPSGVSAAVSAFAGSASMASGLINNITSPSGLISGAAGITNSLSGSLSGALGGAAGGAAGSAKAALSAIGAGGAAAQLTESIGGLGGIQSAMTSMGTVPTLSGLIDKVEGVAASAFNAVKNSFKPLKAGVPQNLTQIAKDNAAEAASLANMTGSQMGGIGNSLSGLAGGASGLTGALSSIAGGASGISSISGSLGGATSLLSGLNNSVSSITGALKNASRAVSAISGLTGSNALGNLGAALSGGAALTNLISRAGGNPLNMTTGGINNAIHSVQGLVGVSKTNSHNDIYRAAQVINSGSIGSLSSHLASGISNLPGGINTIANVVNNAPGATNVIPGASSLAPLIKNATSGLMNGLGTVASVAGAVDKAIGGLSNIGGGLGGLAGGLGGLSGNISGALSGLAGGNLGKLGGLTSLATAGLPVGAIAQLQSSIASLAGGNPSTVSLPSIGFNTLSRDQISGQVDKILGDKGIPSPNLTGSIPESAKQSLDSKVEGLNKQFNQLAKKAQDFRVQDQKLMAEFLSKRDQYGANDPNTKSAQAAWKSHANSAEWINIQKQIENLTG
jgi:hypothetical protein